MKNLTLIILLFPFFLFAQENDYHKKHKRYGQKIAELEKIKLLDYLDLDEETAIKFFARRNEYKENIEAKMKEIRAARKDLDDLLEDSVEEKELRQQIDIILNGNQEIARMKANFVNSLSDILSPTQIAKVVLFDAKFQREIRKYLYNRKKRNTK